MECGVTIIDNFLDQTIFYNLEKVLVDRQDSYFPWYYNDYKVDESFDSIYNYQFTHMFYNKWSPRSDFYNLLMPLLEKINPKSVLKIKGNLTMATDKIYEYGMHKDFTDREINCTTGIFYLNTNNGYTLFENGDKVESIANRLVFFNSEIKHTGTSCTDEKFRCLINLNYFQ